MNQPATLNRALKWLAVAAIAFGVLTVISGGRALFGGAEARAVGALSLRSLFWIAVALVALRAMKATAAGSNPR